LKEKSFEEKISELVNGTENQIKEFKELINIQDIETKKIFRYIQIGNFDESVTDFIDNDIEFRKRKNKARAFITLRSVIDSKVKHIAQFDMLTKAKIKSDKNPEGKPVVKEEDQKDAE